MNSRRLNAFLVLAAVCWLGSCAVNPATGKSDFVLMSEDDEIKLGREAHAQIVQQFGGAYADPGLQAYVQGVGERLGDKSHRNNLIYRFTVLDSPQVNAFALPGGYIYITRGLLAYLNSEAELAAVLGHEIGHVTARHSVRQISGTRAAQIGYTIGSILLPELRTNVGQGLFNVLGGAITSGYGRDHELEADRLGAEYLARSGYDPQAMVKVLGVLKDQEVYERRIAEKEGRAPRIYHGVFATHPSSDRRLQEIVASAGPPDENPDASHGDGFLHHIDGLVYGESDKAGIVRGDAFYHGHLGVSFSLPSGWLVENLPERLVIQAPDRKAVLQVGVEDINQRIPPADYLKNHVKPRKLTQDEEIFPAGLQGYSALIDAASAKRLERISVVYHDNRAYLFAGVSKDGHEKHDAEFIGVARSFHPLTAQERDLARAIRIRLTTAQEGVSFADLARSSPLRPYAEEQLRLLNQLYPEGSPSPGSPIKIVQ